MDTNAPTRQRDGDTPRADTQFEGGTRPGQLDKKLDDRFDRRRREQLRPQDLVLFGDALVKVVGGHPRMMPAARTHRPSVADYPRVRPSLSA